MAELPLANADQDDYTVILHGAKTKRSRGIFSHIKSDCRLPGQPGYTREHVFVGLRGEPFAVRGDSGAFVLDRQGCLVGLLVGGPERGVHAYVTPIGEVCADIKARTDYIVELPQQ